jgi:hypothetical protein
MNYPKTLAKIVAGSQFHFYLTPLMFEQAGKVPISSIEVVNEKNEKLADVSITPSEGELSSLAVPPKWNYSWGPEKNDKGLVYREFLIAPQSIGYFSLYIEKEKVAILYASKQLFIKVKYFDQVKSDVALMYDIDNDLFHLGDLHLYGDMTWKTDLFRIPSNQDPVSLSETYLGWGDVTKTAGEYSRIAQMSSTDTDGWTGSWLGVYNYDDVASEEGGKTKISICYFDNTDNPIVLSFFNSMGYILGKLSNTNSKSYKTDSFYVDDAFFSRRFSGEYQDVHLMQLSTLYDITKKPIYRDYYNKWISYGYFYCPGIDLYFFPKCTAANFKITAVSIVGNSDVAYHNEVELYTDAEGITRCKLKFTPEEKAAMLRDCPLKLIISYENGTSGQAIEMDIEYSVNDRFRKPKHELSCSLDTNPKGEYECVLSDRFIRSIEDVGTSPLYYRLEKQLTE